jgi:hypothetical protein
MHQKEARKGPEVRIHPRHLFGSSAIAGRLNAKPTDSGWSVYYHSARLGAISPDYEKLMGE